MKLAKKKPQSVPTLLLVLLDCVMVIGAGGLALLVRFDFSFHQVPARYLEP